MKTCQQFGLVFWLILLFVGASIIVPSDIVRANHDETHLKDITDLNDSSVSPGPEMEHANPHGNYSNNTNAYGECHSVHTGKSAKILKETTQEQTCYLCHDGRGSNYDAKNGKTYDPVTKTVSDSVAGGFNGTTSSHEVEADSPPPGGKGLQIQMVCTSCHNPHGSSNYRNLHTTVNGRTGVDVKGMVRHNPLTHKETAVYESGMTNFCSSCHEDYMTYYQENPVYDNRHYRHPIETLLTGGKTRVTSGSVPAPLTFNPTLFTTLPTQGVPSGAYPGPASWVITSTSISVSVATGGSLPAGDYEYIVTKLKDGRESIIGAKLAETVAENGRVTVTWPAGTGSDSFQIYRRKKVSSTAFGPVARIKTLKGASSYIDTGNKITTQVPIKGADGLLQSSQTYWYLIQAVTGTDTPYESQLITVILGTGEKSVSLDWDAVPGATKYYLFRADTDGSGGYLPFQMLAKINAVDDGGTPISGADQYIDKGLIGLKPLPEQMPASFSGTLPAGTYYYLVSGVNALGESHQGYMKKIVVSSANSTVVLQWDHIANATGYRVYRAQKATGEPALTEFKLIKDSATDENAFVFRQNAAEGSFYFADGNIALGTDTPKTINSQGANTAKIVCVTCHFAHGTKKVDSSTGHSSLKRIDNSGVCQNCHKR